MALYEVALLGQPSAEHVAQMARGLSEAAQSFGLIYGADLVLNVHPVRFSPPQRTTAVAVYFGGPGGGAMSIRGTLDTASVTVVPVTSTETRVPDEIPTDLRFLNCVQMDRDGADRLLSTVLECLGLLRRQRRVFLSYRRTEAGAAALQMFDRLSARGYDVFLDTHGIARAVDFQETLWQALCNVDVMVMLETPSYFQSRWTREEFGRALAKNIGVLRVQWPDATPSIQTQTCSRVEIVPSELDDTGALAESALRRITDHLERFRSLSFAARRLSVMSQLTAAVENIQGRVLGVGPQFTMRVLLSGGEELSVSPVIGVPDSNNLHDAVVRAEGKHAAVLYDHIGMRASHIEHLSWLSRHVPRMYLIRSSQAAWDLAGVTQ